MIYKDVNTIAQAILLKKNMKITQTAKIKLTLLGTKIYRNLKYRELSEIGNEIRRVKNDTVRACNAFFYMRSNDAIPENPKNNNKHTQNTFVVANRFEVKKAPGTFCRNAEKEVQNKFNRELLYYLRGEKKPLLFKNKTMPVPGGNYGSSLIERRGRYYFLPAVLRNRGYGFRLVGLHKDNYLKAIVDRVVAEEYRFNDSELWQDKRTGIWYLMLSFSFEKARGWGF